MPGLADHAMKDLVEDLVVFDCNWLALEAFLNCVGQWRLSPNGQIQALDYGSLSAVMSMMGIDRAERLDTFSRVRVIESSALAALEKLRAK